MPRRARIFWILTILYWCALFAGTHVPARVIVKVPLSDKIEHLAGYGGLATLLYLSFLFGGRRHPSDIAVLVLGIIICYGAIDEWSQIPVGRDCDLLDWYAEVTGCAVAVVVLTLASRYLDPRQLGG